MRGMLQAMKIAKQDRPSKAPTAVARMGGMETRSRQHGLNPNALPKNRVRTDPANPSAHASRSLRGDVHERSRLLASYPTRRIWE